MTFFESIKTALRKYADFGGRATRPEFWWFTLFCVLVSGALGSLNVTTGGGGWMGGPDGWRDGMMFGQSALSTTLYLGTSLAGVWSFLILLPSLAITIRRLRDTGREWTNIFWILLPIAGLIVLIIFLAEPTKADAPPAPAAVTS